MKRRDFLKVTGGASAHLIVGGSLLSIRRAEADTGLPIAALQAELDPRKDLLVVHESSASAKYDMSFNKRTQISPRVRVVAGSPKAVGSTILWAVNNGLSFTVRSGGHSYEGFSQSPDLVIDVRGMTGIKQQLPIEEDELNASLVFDLVYTPIETPLLKLAKARGLAVIIGRQEVGVDRLRCIARIGLRGALAKPHGDSGGKLFSGRRRGPLAGGRFWAAGAFLWPRMR